MRKKILLLFILAFSLLTAQAQQKDRVGFKAGAGIYRQNSKINGDQEYTDFKAGVMVGLFKEIHLSQFVNFQPELMYLRMGGKPKKGGKINLDYIAVPLLFKFHGKNFGFLIGPQASLLFKAEGADAFDNKEDLKDEYKSIDIGAIAGFEWSFAKQRGLAGIRYQAAINDVWKDSPPKSFLKNNGVQVYIGFRF
jgi:hypothetical protein